MSQQQHQQSRHFPNTIELGAHLDDREVTRTTLRAAAAALKEVKAAALAHRDVSGGGVYVGLAGVALTYLRMAQQLQRGCRYAHGHYLQKHDVSRCLQLAGQLLGEADKLTASKRITFLEGASGVLACRALLAHLQGGRQEQDARVQELLGLWGSHIQGVLPDSECELLYGRAGYLYSLCWLRSQLGHDAVPRALLKDVVRHILDEGLAGAAALAAEGSSSSWPLMWAWHGKRYLGAAHGVAGILYVLLHTAGVIRELDADQHQQPGSGGGGSSSMQQQHTGRYTTALVGAVDALAAAQLPSGNLPTKLGDADDTRVAWCHGAAGLVLVMLKAAEALGDASGRYLAAATAAADDIWERGLLRKGVGLCHGISGNGFALLAMARATGQARYVRAARAFALHAAEHWRELYDVPDRPASLFEGVAGAVNFWLVEDPRHAAWPGVELH